MPNNISSSLPIKILWQGLLVVGLVAGAWVVGQTLAASRKPAAAHEQVVEKSTLQLFCVPRLSTASASAMDAINARISSAKSEIIIAARQIAASSLLNNLKQREAAGVSVVTLLSPDVTADFVNSRLAAWLRQNQVTGFYKDILTSVSHVIVIDERTVIVSDVPFSQRFYEPDEKAASSAALGFVYIIDEADLGRKVAAELKERAMQQNKLL